jgi:hypothetical protein
MIKRHHVKSCCGSKGYIFETSKPIRREHVSVFKEAGYLTPPHYNKVGVFYAEHKGLVATAAFGSTRIQVRCSSGRCSQLMDSLANLLERIVCNDIAK